MKQQSSSSRIQDPAKSGVCAMFNSSFQINTYSLPDTGLNTAGMNSFRPRDNVLRLVLPVTAMLQLEVSRPRDVN